MEAKVVGNMEVECSASVKMMAEDEVDVKEVDGGLVTSTSSSTSDARAPSKIESTKEVAAVEEDIVSEPVVEPALRSLTPLSGQPTDDVPLCSGALPVEPDANAPDEVLPLSPCANSKERADDAAANENKKPPISWSSLRMRGPAGMPIS